MNFELIQEREAALDQALPPERLTGKLPSELIVRAAAWSDAVWQAAVAEGPLDLDVDTIERGVQIAERPIVICGVHRSGTTLLRDLLDDHPAVAVLPSEGNFFTNFAAQLASQSANEARTFFANVWLRRVANPINQRPYWLLGRTTASESPYVIFGRALLAWWPVVERRLAKSSSWPLAAVTLAYAQARGHGELPVSLTRWAEKTPTNEQHLDRVWHERPSARVLHVVRHPYAVFASRKRAEERSSGQFRNARRVLDDLRRSYEIAAERQRTADPNRYRVVRYEDLIADPSAAMKALAAYLEIEPLAVLTQPTVAGLPSISNTSFEMPGDAGRIEVRGRGEELSQRERDLIGAVVGKSAAHVGYRIPRPGLWRAVFLGATNS